MTTIKLEPGNSESKQTVMQTGAYWENLVKRSLCRFLLLAQLAKGPVHGYGINQAMAEITFSDALNQAIKEACQGCCEPTEAMVYSTMKELQEGGYVDCRMEEHQGRQRRVCWLTDSGEEAFKAAARVWQRMIPTVEDCVEQALLKQDK